MTSIFQVLIDFLDFLISPIYLLLYTAWDFINHLLLQVLWCLCRAFCFILNGVIAGYSFAIDKIFVCLASTFSYIAPSGGIFSTLGLGKTNFVTDAVNYGAVGITWLKNFVDPSVVFIPLCVYISFLLTWTVYKIVKSWIPSVSGGG